MKKPLIILAVALTVAACNSNKTSSSSDNTDTTVTTTTTTITTKISSTLAANDTTGKSLIAKNDCLTCHKLDQKVIGPAYIDVAEKYTASPVVIDTLASKVIKGGSGNWGAIAMTPHPTLSMTDAKEMVKYILSLKK